MDLGLRDRVVLITGGGGGSGPTLGRAFAAEGAFVALHHRTGSASAVRAEEAAAGIVAAGGAFDGGGASNAWDGGQAGGSDASPDSQTSGATTY